jgi:3-oxoacyl-[acyl-carrier protein] reductase
VNGVRFDFRQARVAVTGGTSGIGFEVATRFAEAGAIVTVTGRRPSAADYEVDLTKFAYAQCELADPTSVEAFAERLPALDVLVNNAGATFPAGRDEWDPVGFADALTANLAGTMRLSVRCREALATSSLTGGASVVNIVSMASFRAAQFVPGYASAKAGLGALTMNLARHWVGDGIRVNAVAPGFTATGLTELAMGIPEVMEAEMRHTPMGRPAAPADIAGTVLFLCTDAASYVTGATFAVDGGYLLV